MKKKVIEIPNEYDFSEKINRLGQDVANEVYEMIIK